MRRAPAGRRGSVTDPFAVMNAIGLVGFAFVGAAKAVEERYDVFGVTVVGVMTALGGGTTRDLLLNRVPNSLQSPDEVAYHSLVSPPLFCSCISSTTATSIRSS